MVLPVSPYGATVSRRLLQRVAVQGTTARYLLPLPPTATSYRHLFSYRHILPPHPTAISGRNLLTAISYRYRLPLHSPANIGYAATR
eukprot:3089792-Rhodomonas_salina.1